MKTSKVFKKLSAIIMVFAMVFGLFGISGGGITAKAATNPVKMYCFDYGYYHRGYSSYTVYMQIEASSAANKTAYVHYNAGEAGWVDEAATYVTKLDSNTEIWKATVGGYFSNIEYAIKYIGDGHEYWDNNNGNNYTADDVLGQANVKVRRLPYQSLSNFNIKATLKNLAYTKVVKVRYTLDNWATYQDVALNYEKSSTTNNTEDWGVTLNLDESKRDSFQYCVSYEVNGQTHWDNNFGANYDRTYYSPY